MKSKVVAIGGKGGVGKTTVAAVMANALARERKRKVLLVDADPAGGLATALAFSVTRTLNHIRLDTIREIKSGETGARDLAISLDYRLLEALVERGNLAFLAIGRPEEVGCYCSVNTLLREALEVLAGQFELTVIDAEAGIEQVNRKVMSKVTDLVLVSDLSAKGLKVAEMIRQVAQQIGSAPRSGLLLNRVRSEEEAAEVAGRVSLPVIGFLPEDETIRHFDTRELSFFDLPPCPASLAVAKALVKAEILD